MEENSWKAILAERLPLLGHRNWIGVVDSAYPWQAAAGLETVATRSDHLVVLKAVLAAIRRAPHVRPLTRLDAELAALSESAAPGIGVLRNEMDHLLDKVDISVEPHDAIIARLDASARRFHIVLFKTTLVLPYTSVFFELDCGYWSAAAEKSLRSSLSKTHEPF